jgi:spermidine dehydrogenase
MDDPPRDGITRRDFLDGVAVGTAALAAAAATPSLTGAQAAALPRRAPAPLPDGYYPPTTTGLRGIPDRVVEQIVRIDGLPDQEDVHSSDGGPGINQARADDGEATYDCIIVGAGISGLAAAKYYRDRFGEGARILLLDPLPDFGGHAQRNEFHIGDTMLLRNGGAVNLDSIGTWSEPAGALMDIPGSYTEVAVDLIEELGVDWEDFPATINSSIPGSYGLRQMLLFPAAEWGADHLVQNRTGGESWPAFLARTPFSPAAREAIARIQTDATDWLAAKHPAMSVEERRRRLTEITYRRYLMEYVGAPEEALRQYQRSSHGLFGAGIQAVSAADMWALGSAGFAGVDIGEEPFPGLGRTPEFALSPNADPTIAWPDGNASLARLLVSRLIPEAFPDGEPDALSVVQARCDYAALDGPANSVRLRLNSLVTRVTPGFGKGADAKIDYIVGGKGRRARAAHVVMACWNRVTAQIVQGLPEAQVEGLTYARKVPLIYGRAGLRNWQAFADAKISSVSPRGNSLFWDSTTLNAGASFDGVYGPTPVDPSKPAILTFQVVPTDHGATPQLAAYEGGRKVLLETPFAELEAALWNVLDRSVNASGGDFDPERDVEALMVNRWNYGYAHELTSVWDPSLYGPVAEQPHVIGRRPFANVAIANSDSGALAYAHSAIAEAHRAIDDLPGAVGKHAGKAKQAGRTRG